MTADPNANPAVIMAGLQALDPVMWANPAVPLLVLDGSQDYTRWALLCAEKHGSASPEIVTLLARRWWCGQQDAGDLLRLLGRLSKRHGRGSEVHVSAVLAACACARTSLRYVPVGETRPLVAIETAERWARGEATLEEVRVAKRAAAYAANAAASYASHATAAVANYTIDANGYAAAVAVDAADAVAAEATCHDVTRSSHLALLADLVRATVSWEQVARWLGLEEP